MHQEQSAGCIVFSVYQKQNLYLLLQHTNGGHWDFPKGKIEAQETKYQAALRELKEEADIEAVIYDNFEEKIEYTYFNFDGVPTQKTVFFFVALATNPHPTISHEHTDFGWYTYEEALNQLTYPNARAVLTKAHAFLNTQ